MDNLKFYKLFLALVNKENALNELSKYIRNPAVNRNKHLINLFEFLKNHQKGTYKKELSKKTIFNKLFGNNTLYNETKLQKQFSLFNHLLEDFMVLRTLKNELPSYYLKLAVICYELNLSKGLKYNAS